MAKPKNAKGKNNTKEKKEKEKEVLSFTPTGRTISIYDIEAEVRLIKKTFEENEQKKIAASKAKNPNKNKKPLVFDEVSIKRIAEGYGTHLLKMASSDATGQSALKFETENRRRLYPSINSSDIPLAKVISRPLEILEDGSCLTLVDHLQFKNNMSSKVIEAYENVFGKELIRTLERELNSPSKPVTKLQSDKLPIVFVPTEDGEDIQITPIAPADSYNSIRRIQESFKIEVNKFPKQTGKWLSLSISDKPRNICGMLIGYRYRFRAEMPETMSRNIAEIYKYVKSSHFPTFRDRFTANAVINYANFLEKYETGARQVKDAANNIAKMLVNNALSFIERVVDETANIVEEENLKFDFPAPPSPKQVLKTLYFEKENHRIAMAALSSRHFSEIEKKIVAGK